MFNLFKKKEQPKGPSFKKPRTVLCIPGNWNDRTEIVTAIAENNMHEFIFAGMVLLNLKTNKGFTLEICERDVRMIESFKWAGMVNGISDDFMSVVDQHKYVIYLSAETGDLESARAIAEAGCAILRAGGIGVKVDTTGKAFTKDHWTKLAHTPGNAALYQMFVVDSIRDEAGRVFTCGMHNLGLKDSIVYDEPFQEAVDLLSIFGYYQIMDKPDIKSGQTFGISAEAPVFTIFEEKAQPYQGDELFGNPFGMWQLRRKRVK